MRGTRLVLPEREQLGTRPPNVRIAFRAGASLTRTPCQCPGKTVPAPSPRASSFEGRDLVDYVARRRAGHVSFHRLNLLGV